MFWQKSWGLRSLQYHQESPDRDPQRPLTSFLSTGDNVNWWLEHNVVFPECMCCSGSKHLPFAVTMMTGISGDRKGSDYFSHFEHAVIYQCAEALSLHWYRLMSSGHLGRNFIINYMSFLVCDAYGCWWRIGLHDPADVFLKNTAWKIFKKEVTGT